MKLLRPRRSYFSRKNFSTGITQKSLLPRAFYKNKKTDSFDTKVSETIGLLLVEVARLELTASSTRNWRATTCATPRQLYYYIEKKALCQVEFGKYHQ